MSGPRWTLARLRRMLVLRFGANRQGRPDMAAVAVEVEVSIGTVRRWLRGGPRATPVMPPHRLEQLIALVTPSMEAVRDENQQLAHAVRSIALIAAGDVLESWRDQGWLEPHTVTVIAPHHQGIQQVVTTKNSARDSHLVQRRGHVLDVVEVPTRFHASVVALRLLQAVGPWRFQPGPGELKVGRTRAWLSEAARPKLASLQEGG